MFWIELSYRYATIVPVLKTQITSDHFCQLMAAERLEPRGESRADLRVAINTAVLANCNRAKGKPAFKPADFMPEFGAKPTPDPKKLAADLAANFARLANQTKGKKGPKNVK